jgi:uncharacterized protein YndB with AHSA1/START domain
MSPGWGTGLYRMSPDASTRGSVVVTRELDVPPTVAWRAWCDPALIRRWWGPAGFSCPRADVDFRVGGSTLVTMQAPAEWGGVQFHNRWTYTLINEPSRIEFLSEFVDADARVISPATAGIPLDVPAQVPHVVALEPLVDGRTQLTVIETGYTNEQARQQSTQGQEQCLDKMQALLART